MSNAWVREEFLIFSFDHRKLLYSLKNSFLEGHRKFYCVKTFPPKHEGGHGVRETTSFGPLEGIPYKRLKWLPD